MLNSNKAGIFEGSFFGEEGEGISRSTNLMSI